MRGATLVEVLLAAGLLLVLMTLVTQVLWPLMGAYRKGDRQAVLSQSVASAMARLVAELQESNLRGLTCALAPLPDVPVALLVQPLGGTTPSGGSLWARELHLLFQRQDRLWFRVATSPALTAYPSRSPFPVPGADLPGLLRATDGLRPLLNGVERFEVSGLEVAQKEVPLRLKLAARLSTGEHFELTQDVLLRNRRSR